MTKRERLLPQIRHLRDSEGWAWHEIASYFGLSTSTVSDYYQDPTGAKARERKAMNNGVCIDCAGETRGGGAAVAPRRCQPCNVRWERSDVLRRIQRGETAGRILWTDEQIFDAIRSASTNGVVSVPAYLARYTVEARGTMPSTAIIVKRFGLWSAAVEAAGLRLAGTRRGPYSTRMPDEGIALAIEECAADVGHPPTYNEYVEWAQLNDAPSGPLARVRFGTWTAAIAPLIETGEAT